MTNECVLVEPPATADAAVIWLHGLGADNTDFTGVVHQLGLPANHGVRFIFPNAPHRLITINNGMRMRAWYNIYDLNMLRKEDQTGIKESQASLLQLLQEQVSQGIKSERVFLAGFSQGASMSLYAGLRCDQPLGGIIALSGYLPLSGDFVPQEYPSNRDIPIFMAHGLLDPIVPVQIGKSSAQFLLDNNYKVQWNSYAIPHTVIAEEIEHVGTFLRGCLGYA